MIKLLLFSDNTATWALLLFAVEYMRPIPAATLSAVPAATLLP